MRFSTASSIVALTALAAAQVEDALYSRHIAKRDIDANGNYNICQ
jgi:5'-nucleotidase